MKVSDSDNLADVLKNLSQYRKGMLVKNLRVEEVLR